MLIKTQCHCGHVNQSEASIRWAREGAVPVRCEDCGDVYLATTTVDEETHSDTDEYNPKPETHFEIASRVIIENEEHELNGQEGIIVDKDFLHYKVKLADGKAIWLPYHWVVLKKTT